jgi:uncharacterized protein (TIGR00106 family)
MAILQVSVVPIGTSTTSLSSWVSECLRVLADHPNLKYELTPMSTVIEGSLEDALKALKDMHEAPFAHGAQRVFTSVSIDDRRDRQLTLRGKVDSVVKKLKG